MNEARTAEMLNMREQGMTFKEIAIAYNISKQRVHQIIGRENKSYFITIRKDCCVFDAIRNWMNENKISMAELTRRLYGNSGVGNQKLTKSRLSGKFELKKTFIDKILTITNLTYEEAFKRSDTE